MIIGIDATNLLQGGGQTHLIEFLSSLDKSRHDFSKVVLWGSKNLIDKIPTRSWIESISYDIFEKNIIYRTFWQITKMKADVIQRGCTVLFVPGGNHLSNFSPAVTMCRNMLTFEKREAARYGISKMWFRLAILGFLHKRSFKKSEGLIFLTDYARQTVQKQCKKISSKSITIPHGINKNFFQLPRVQKSIKEFKFLNLFKIVYVSKIDVYKHQINVVKAFAEILTETNWPMSLKLVGPSYYPELKRLEDEILKYKFEFDWISYSGEVKYNELPKLYRKAELGIFASSCENMPNILLEMMASGIPIACSNIGPMSEIFGDKGAYFNPLKVNSIKKTLLHLINNKFLRKKIADYAYERSKKYNWEKCTDNTVQYLKNIEKSEELFV